MYGLMWYAVTLSLQCFNEELCSDVLLGCNERLLGFANIFQWIPFSIYVVPVWISLACSNIMLHRIHIYAYWNLFACWYCWTKFVRSMHWSTIVKLDFARAQQSWSQMKRWYLVTALWSTSTQTQTTTATTTAICCIDLPRFHPYEQYIFWRFALIPTFYSAN